MGYLKKEKAEQITLPAIGTRLCTPTHTHKHSHRKRVRKREREVHRVASPAIQMQSQHEQHELRAGMQPHKRHKKPTMEKDEKLFANDLNDDGDEAEKRRETMLGPGQAKGFGFGDRFGLNENRRERERESEPRESRVGVGAGVSCTWPSNKSNNAGQTQHQSDLYCILARHIYIHMYVYI